MKALHADIRKAGWLTLGYALLLTGLLALTAPGLISKIQMQRHDRALLFALDGESLDATQSWSLANAIRCTHIVLNASDSAEQEARVRALKVNVLWRIPDDPPSDFVSRVQPGDWVFLSEKSLEHPLIYLTLPSRLLDHGGVCAPEFERTRALAAWASRYHLRVAKSHFLGTREMLAPKADAWRARLVRAVEERWVRCIVVHVSPVLTGEENVQLLQSVAEGLVRRGYSIDNAVEPVKWKVAALSSQMRWGLVLLISLLTPLFLLYWVRRLNAPALLRFLGASFISVLTGIVIHALGATPAFVLGLYPLRGVKLQLCGALLLAMPFLFSKEDIRAVVREGIPSSAFRGWAIAAFIVVAVYVMRSGNHPLLPVTDLERQLRDTLETLFVARPRFKEFLFGHPLFLAGLWLTRRPVLGRWWGDGRAFLLLGLVGQISILNTFTHFHAPFFYCAVRTVHGIWLGLVLAIIGQRLLRLNK